MVVRADDVAAPAERDRLPVQRATSRLPPYAYSAAKPQNAFLSSCCSAPAPKRHAELAGISGDTLPDWKAESYAMPKLMSHGSEYRYCAPAATCQVSLYSRFCVTLVGLLTSSMPSWTCPNFDHCCHPTLPSSAQRSLVSAYPLSITPCGTLMPTFADAS